nr:DUF305 domain-containing protein [Deinococcus humi]
MSWPTLVGVSLLGLGVGGAITWAGTRPPAEGSPEVRFARDMSAHHAQAVDMSVTLLKRANDRAVRVLAQDVALTQQAQIGQMSGWLMAWNRPLSGLNAPMAGMNREAMGIASVSDVRQLEDLSPAVAESRYLVLMRKHHLGGVAMAKSALNTVRAEPVRAFAQRVVVSQTAEINAIDALLEQRALTPPADTPGTMDEMNHDQ